MDKTYWIGRKRAAMAMARAAATSEARLIHYDLAGRYSIRAAHSFMLPDKGPATQSERVALQLPRRARPRPGGGPGGPAEGGA